jgi:hypothetical protein
MSDWDSIPDWRTGDLVSAAKLNETMDAIDMAIGYHEQRIPVFDSGGTIGGCPGTFARPSQGWFSGNRAEFWVAFNGDTLVIRHSSPNNRSVWLYWDWNGIEPGTPGSVSASAEIAAGSDYEFVIPSPSSYSQFQPVRFLLLSTANPANELFIDYIYMTDSNAPAGLGTMPAFTNGATSATADLRTVRTATITALDTLMQPVPCNYSNDDLVAARNYYVGYIRHTHSQFYVDLTLDINDNDFFNVTIDNQDVTGTRGRFDGTLTGDMPAGLTIGNWYRVLMFVNVAVPGYTDTGQRIKIWSMGQRPGSPLSSVNSMTRWAHGDVLNGSAGGPPRLVQMSDALDALGANLLYVNQPCRVPGVQIGDNCAGADTVDGMAGYRVHRWLAYKTKVKADYNSRHTGVLQWFAAGRNLQSYSLPTVEAPAFFDLESTPIKPGMWFRAVGVEFAIQTAVPGTNYA